MYSKHHINISDHLRALNKEQRIELLRESVTGKKPYDYIRVELLIDVKPFKVPKLRDILPELLILAINNHSILEQHIYDKKEEISGLSNLQNLIESSKIDVLEKNLNIARSVILWALGKDASLLRNAMTQDPGLKSKIANIGFLEEVHDGGITPLAFASKSNNRNEITVLLEMGANIRTLDKKLNTILHQACLASKEEIDMDVIGYIISILPEDLILATNNNERTKGANGKSYLLHKTALQILEERVGELGCKDGYDEVLSALRAKEALAADANNTEQKSQGDTPNSSIPRKKPNGKTQEKLEVDHSTSRERRTSTISWPDEVTFADYENIHTGKFVGPDILKEEVIFEAETISDEDSIPEELTLNPFFKDFEGIMKGREHSSTPVNHDDEKEEITSSSKPKPSTIIDQSALNDTGLAVGTKKGR
jgi:hypothetical protein